MEEETASRKLTKKEKKALAFRTNAGNKGKGKGKKVTGDLDQMAVPETDDLDDEGVHANAEEGEKKVKKDKKRKRDETDADADTATAAEGEAAEADSEEPKKKKRQRGKKPSQRNREAAAANASKLLLFIGNLPYKVTIEEIKTHFTPCGEVPEVRLLTPKPKVDAAGATPTTTKSKGCAFIEFTSPFALQSAFRLHESELNGRKINVELTAGGGGNSEARKKKLQDKRATMQKERERVALNRKKKDIEAGKLNPDGSRLWGQPKPSATAATAGAEGGSAWAASSSGQDGAGSTALNGAEKKIKKVRDRRLVKDGPAAARSKPVKAPKAMTGANSIKLGSF
ncbi:BZ3500_MvSof-1268-A1-R1_Chr7-1g09214 [Microbotryum saponariae]|uniref:BZ3500_MvSof-1268-A1-R1_Chr7-1g09214 protein n=1 Tax=Microbotryum saponariae TaxID=289078 RepID=A0A2X0LI26_9BASI|nr:BZ3501_MvSof-1269-A2-R1_Chr7-1g08919 [Microbotryum saponariae]SDA03011.1 BZ3500_MvSof-1268-A1-R1_Chr7-1g09214 [Microbotryum saponariae]